MGFHAARAQKLKKHLKKVLLKIGKYLIADPSLSFLLSKIFLYHIADNLVLS